MHVFALALLFERCLRLKRRWIDVCIPVSRGLVTWGGL